MVADTGPAPSHGRRARPARGRMPAVPMRSRTVRVVREVGGRAPTVGLGHRLGDASRKGLPIPFYSRPNERTNHTYAIPCASRASPSVEGSLPSNGRKSVDDGASDSRALTRARMPERSRSSSWDRPWSPRVDETEISARTASSFSRAPSPASCAAGSVASPRRSGSPRPCVPERTPRERRPTGPRARVRGRPPPEPPGLGAPGEPGLWRPARPLSWRVRTRSGRPRPGARAPGST